MWRMCELWFSSSLLHSDLVLSACHSYRVRGDPEIGHSSRREPQTVDITLGRGWERQLGQLLQSCGSVRKRVQCSL